MTLGEFAKSIADEIADRAGCKSDVRGVIGDASMLLEGLPAQQMKWFWQEVAGQLTSHRPIEQDELAQRITSALAEVQAALESCGRRRVGAHR